MRINEAAERAGISAKNIRFYESQGLIAPGRESGNGYRSYSEADVERLCRIRLLRLLDVPLSECRAMLEGHMTLADGMRRHIVTLQARRQDLESTLRLCEALQNEPGLEGVDLPALQARVEAEQKKGVQFMDVEKRDILRRRSLGAVVGALLFGAFLLWMVAMLAWAQSVDPLPWWLFALMMALPAAAAIAVLAMLYQRLREIRKGELDEYKEY